MNSSFIKDKWIGSCQKAISTDFITCLECPKILALFQVLCNSHGLHGSSKITKKKVVAITLYILAQNESIRYICERFQHSSETIYRYFINGLNILCRLSTIIVKLIDQTFRETPKNIVYDYRYMSCFKIKRTFLNITFIAFYEFIF